MLLDSRTGAEASTGYTITLARRFTPAGNSGGGLTVSYDSEAE